MGSHSLLNDIIFKIVFGSEQNLPLLKALVNALLNLTGNDRIIDLKILNPYVDREYLKEKGAILDIKARDEKGHLYNIEVQLWDDPSYIKKALYCLSRLFGGQIERGEEYERLAKTIGISLVDFELFPDLGDVHSRYRFHDSVHGRDLTDILEMHFIEFAKVRKTRPVPEWSSFEKWLHVLKYAQVYEQEIEPIPEVLKEEEGIEMALDAMKRAYSSDEVREMIEFRMKAMRDEATRLANARRQGFAEGEAAGEAKGEARGEAIGKEKGLQEAARRMLAQGMDRETVMRVLDLRPEQMP